MCHTLRRIFQCLRDAFLHVLAVYAVVRPQRDNRDTRFCADCRHLLVPLAALVLMVGRVVDLHSDFRRKGCVGNQEIHIAEQLIAERCIVDPFNKRSQIDLREHVVSLRDNFL